MQRGKAKAELCWKTLRSCGPGTAAIFAEGKHGASSPCSVWGRQGSDSRRVSCPRPAVRSGEGRLLETECRPTLRKKLLNWLKDSSEKWKQQRELLLPPDFFPLQGLLWEWLLKFPSSAGGCVRGIASLGPKSPPSWLTLSQLLGGSSLMTSEACSFPCLLPSLLGAGKPLLCNAALGIGPSLPFLPAPCQARVLGCAQVPAAP